MEPAPRQRVQPEQAAAALALILGSQLQQATKTAEIATMLYDVALEAATIPVEIAEKIAKALAILVVVRALLNRRGVAKRREGGISAPLIVSGTPTSGIAAPQRQSRSKPEPEADEDELLRRAMYAVRGSQRMALDIAGGRSPEKALERESRHYLSHTEAAQRRRTQKRIRAVLSEEYGGLAGWKHGDPKEARVLHQEANGFNFRSDGSPPRATGRDWPGEKPGCTCVAVAPFPGAKVMD